jgi:hypothetical protein
LQSKKENLLLDREMESRLKSSAMPLGLNLGSKYIMFKKIAAIERVSIQLGSYLIKKERRVNTVQDLAELGE